MAVIFEASKFVYIPHKFEIFQKLSTSNMREDLYVHFLSGF